MENVPEIRGLETDIPFFRAEEAPYVDHGIFKINNNTKETCLIKIDKVYLTTDKTRTERNNFFIYEDDTHEELSKSGFLLEPGEQLKIRVTFQRTVLDPEEISLANISVDAFFGYPKGSERVSSPVVITEEY